MGTTILHRVPANKKAYLASELSFTSPSTGNVYRVVADSMVGSTYYAAVEKRAADGSVSVEGVVVTTETRDGEFAYKEIAEVSGPYFWDCPAKVLNALTPTQHASALDWRATCRNTIVQKAIAKKLKTGDVIKFDTPLNFGGAYGYLDTFTVDAQGRSIRFTNAVNRNLTFYISKWKTRPFAIVSLA